MTLYFYKLTEAFIIWQCLQDLLQLDIGTD
jgi:hypothetical protein